MNLIKQLRCLCGIAPPSVDALDDGSGLHVELGDVDGGYIDPSSGTQVVFRQGALSFRLASGDYSAPFDVAIAQWGKLDVAYVVGLRPLTLLGIPVALMRVAFVIDYKTRKVTELRAMTQRRVVVRTNRIARRHIAEEKNDVETL